MTPVLAKRLRWVASTISVLVLVALVAAMWFHAKLVASRPQLDGSEHVAGLSAPVSVTRDALGVPTIVGKNRSDVARALGFLHAQDRFFQMDTLRRRAAGEVAALVGKPGVALDRSTRIHGFRRLAQTVLKTLNPEEHALLDAYAAGVNAGVAALSAKPFEYVLLRTSPEAWLPEDTLLVGYAMCLELEDSTGSREQSLMVMRDKLSAAAPAFFAPVVTPDDAAIDGSVAPLAPMPTEKQIDLRQRHVQSTPLESSGNLIARTKGLNSRRNWSEFAAPIAPRDLELIPGSNTIALGRDRTANGSALLGVDMHLDLRVPNTWYRASLQWPDHTVTGATLPGTPLVVVGSNTHVAWGFTVSGADRTDLIVIQPSGDDPTAYLRDNQAVLYEIREETIAVKGSDPVTVKYRWTSWGPIVGTDEKSRSLALHWAAHDPTSTNFRLRELEDAPTVDAAIAVAQHAGVPSLNFQVVDTAGRIGWTIAGFLPRRIGYDGRFPTTWYYGDRAWRGWLSPEAVPAVIAPPEGQLWTANNRVVGGAGLAALGDGGYATPPRGVQLRDDLTALKKATPADLLAVQLDDRALFLLRWQKKLLEVLTPDVVAGKSTRAEFRSAVEKWEARASVDSVGYRLVRGWRTSVAELAFNRIFASCAEEYSGFSWRAFNYEPALWTMLQDKPPHLLDPRYHDWDALMVAAVDDVIAKLAQDGVPISGATWGRRNRARIQHPLAGALPAWMTSWLSMPPDPLPGDINMPRIQSPAFGASERMVVSPGRETEGIFEMPGGQSAHPLSPFFRAGHEAWVKGEPSPLLPGKTEHTLILQP